MQHVKRRLVTLNESWDILAFTIRPIKLAISPASNLEILVQPLCDLKGTIWRIKYYLQNILQLTCFAFRRCIKLRSNDGANVNPEAHLELSKSFPWIHAKEFHSSCLIVSHFAQLDLKETCTKILNKRTFEKAYFSSQLGSAADHSL